MQVFDFLPAFLQHAMVSVSSLFVGEGWHLTLGALFMVIVIFLPGGLMEGFNRLRTLGSRVLRRHVDDPEVPDPVERAPGPAE